jgi:hypothetical protein
MSSNNKTRSARKLQKKIMKKNIKIAMAIHIFLSCQNQLPKALLSSDIDD